jgi:hypothetical protein
MAQTTPFAVSGPGASHVIIELFGGDNSLSAFVNEDLAEMADGLKAAKGNHFAILALADTRDSGGKVIEIGRDGKLRTIEDLGEIDTGDPGTLASFIARALRTYPHSRKALGFWHHGSGCSTSTTVRRSCSTAWPAGDRRPRCSWATSMRGPATAGCAAASIGACS